MTYYASDALSKKDAETLCRLYADAGSEHDRAVKDRDRAQETIVRCHDSMQSLAKEIVGRSKDTYMPIVIENPRNSAECIIFSVIKKADGHELCTTTVPFHKAKQ
jgi:hypothetical protein